MDIILIAFYNLSAPLFVYSRNGLTLNIGIARSTQTQGPFRPEYCHLSVQQEIFQQRAQEASPKKKKKARCDILCSLTFYRSSPYTLLLIT